MKTRRSKRLSNPPASSINEDNDLTNNGKKQKLEKDSLTVDTKNGNIISPKEEKERNGLGRFPKSTNVNGYDSDSSASSTEYMKSPNALDLDSDFFKVDFRKGCSSSDFSVIENKIFSHVQHLSDAEGLSSDEDSENELLDYIPIPIVSRSLGQKEGVQKEVSNKRGKKSNKALNTSVLHNSEITDRSNKKKSQKGSTNIKQENNSVDKMGVSELLALGEMQGGNDVEKTELPSASEEELSDWEEVKTEAANEIKQEHHSFPKEGVQITVDAPDLYHKRKKKGFDMVAYVKRRMNRVKKEQQILIHKVHLLCWIAHGLHVNSILNSEEVMGLSLSLIPSQHSYPNRVDINYLKKIAGWFVKTVPVVEMEKSSSVPLLQSLQQQFEQGTAQSRCDLVLMFICLLRSLGLAARLIISLQPIPLRVVNNEICDDKNKRKQQNKKMEKKKVEKKILSPDQAKELQKKVMSKEEAVKRLKSSGTSEKIKTSSPKKPRVERVSKEQNENHQRSFRPRKNTENKYKDVSSSSEEEINHEKKITECISKENDSTELREYDAGRLPKYKAKSSSTGKAVQTVNVKGSSSSKVNTSSPKQIKKCDPLKNTTLSGNDKITRNPSEKNTNSAHMKTVKRSDRKDTGKTSTTMDMSTSKEISSSGNKSRQKTKINVDHHSSCTSQTSGDEFIPLSQNCRASTSGKQKEKKNTMKKHKSVSRSESDTDFEHELTNKVKQRTRNSTNKNDVDRRVLSTDSDDDRENDVKIKNDFWTEVFVDSEEWIAINVITGEVNCVEKLRKGATKPVTYIVAWNPDLSLKDVTRRYCTQFHSVTRKQRVDEEWWGETLFPFLSSNTARDKKEDDVMQKQIQELPLPTSIAEYKNHPLYALKRHLLKFQAIYPPNPPTLGFVKGEPVYARECVHTLHSRDIWLKEAKVVRLGEKPYKIVKARPKWDRMSGKVITDMPLEIFGSWQIEDYVPPAAIDGKIPRNAYGNVELFKPSMLPKGTVHLQVPGLNRVAKKLQIDCAPAVVGFDFHCGASHPMYDGFVVCEEFQDVLLDAWNRDQEEAERRGQEKRDKRVYGNWRRLIKGLLIRERLKIKYSFGEEEASTSKGKKEKKSKPVTKKKTDVENTVRNE